MPEETRVFDVSKPNQVSPSATSRPVIVGHHPETSDPMVKDDSHLGADSAGEATKIPITDASLSTDPSITSTGTSEPSDFLAHAEEPQHHEISDSAGAPAIFSAPESEADKLAASPEPSPVGESTTDPFAPPADAPTPQPDPLPPMPDEPQPHIEGLQFTQPPRKGGRLPLIILVILLLLAGLYLAIDDNLIAKNVNLPVHFFKQKAAPSPTASTSNKPAVSTPAIPSGFKEYKLAGTALTFAAPSAWGDPTSTTEPGFSARGGDNKTDGTYAYLVDFASNKDIQIAVTSSKFLPAARVAQYFDYLQWCTGTNDGKIYESVLHFTTANKVDTPSTVTCDQGPVPSATKIDSTVIVQAKAQDTSNKVIGDIYTKNLDDKSLVVIRVKDGAMTNGTDIKSLLKTVKVTASATNTSP